MASSDLTLRLLIDTKCNKVVFAEASKDVVDFLFSLLAMPVGTVVKLLTAKNKDSIAGGIAKVYRSLEQLDDSFLQPNQDKNSLLDPVILSTTSVNTLLLPAAASGSSGDKKYYLCSYFNHQRCRSYYTETSGAQCPACHNQMTTLLTLVGRNVAQTSVQTAEGSGGVVKGVVTYTIADDLTVTPMSTISSIVFLNHLKFKDLGMLKQKNVSLDLEKGLELLKASLQSKTVLSDVFLGGVKNSI